MKKSVALLCAIFLIGFVLNGCAPSEAAVSSVASSRVSSSTSSAVQNSSTSEEQNITLEKDKISKDVVFRRGSTADGKIVLASDQIEKIEMKHSQTSTSPGVYAITFYLTEEGRKQFSKSSQEIVEAKDEMSIWGKDGKVTSAKITDPILDGTFVLNGSYSLEEAKQHLKSFSIDAILPGSIVSSESAN